MTCHNVALDVTAKIEEKFSGELSNTGSLELAACEKSFRFSGVLSRFYRTEPQRPVYHYKHAVKFQSTQNKSSPRLFL